MATITILLSACAASRDVAGDFTSINKGQIPKSKVPEFINCLSEKFIDRQFGFGKMLSRQQRRGNVFRVEVVADTGLLISADTYDDGRVELFEDPHAKFMTGDERKGFALCLDKYKSIH